MGMMCRVVLNGAVIGMNRLVVGWKGPLHPSQGRLSAASLRALLWAPPFCTLMRSFSLFCCKMPLIPHLACFLPALWFERSLVSPANGTQALSPSHGSALPRRRRKPNSSYLLISGNACASPPCRCVMSNDSLLVLILLMAVD